jgi:Concanavalin A-like lectin/glucanases superfamily/Carboxypeptidase regulatory-like domain/Dockerin type I domain
MGRWRRAAGYFGCVLLFVSMGWTLFAASYCLDFDGSNDYVESVSIGTLSSKTLSAWVKLDNLNGGVGVVTIETAGVNFDSITYDETGQGWGFGSHGFQRTAWSGVRETQADVWIHIAATWEDGSFKMYRNGDLILTTTAFNTYDFPANAKVFVGVRCWSAFGFLNGKIDEVRVWNVVRTQAQIQADMHRELAGNESGLVAYYQMTDGSGTALTDNTAASTFDATIVNGASWLTLTESQPTVTTTSTSSITGSSATSGGTLSDTDWTTTGGVCWNTTGTPTVTNSRTTDIHGGGTFSSSITGLSGNTTYYVRAYATSNAGVTTYGSQDNFTTSAETNGDWQAQHVTLYNTAEADMMARSGDIDNLGYGWPAGFDPFSGNSTPAHAFPFNPEVDDVAGTDDNLKSARAIGCMDGYCPTAVAPTPIALSYNLQGATVTAATLQMFVDDFQPMVFGSHFIVTIDGVEIPLLSAVVNSLSQTGPIGKLITVQLPSTYLPLVADGAFSVLVDDTTTTVGDGFAVDFVKLLVNASASAYTGTIQGTVTNSANGTNIEGALITVSAISDQSEATGGYQLADVPAGQALVEVSKTGFISQSRLVDLIDNEVEIQNFSLVEDTSLLTLSFTDGSSFSPNVTPGQDTQLIGRFQLSGASVGATLAGVAIRLDGTRTGISNLKFWQSSDDAFDAGMDTQLGYTIHADPGDGSSITFSGMSSEISTSESYFFLTGDVAGSATGQIRAFIPAYEQMTVEHGVFSGSISDAALSTGDVPLAPPDVGDIDADGEITPRDVRRILAFVSGCEVLSAAQQNEADIDGDGDVDLDDARILAEYIVGIRTTLP